MNTQIENSVADSTSVFKTQLQEFVYMNTYSRWIPSLKRRETWPETVMRTITFLEANCKVKFELSEWDEMADAMLNLEALPSMRCVQMGGPALERDNTGVYNCAYLAIDSVDSFAELLYILMQGTGCSFSVEDRYVSKIPKVRKQRSTNGKLQHIIGDSTEHWCDALKLGINTWLTGGDVVFDYTLIRPAGSVLRTKGGRSAGPQPLKDLLEFTKRTILARQGKKLTTLDCHDIACYVGYIVQVGGVRRSAELSLSDLDDTDIAGCKNGEFWNKHPQRSMSNNSAVFEEKPTSTEFMEEWLNLAKSGTGERGIFNRKCTIPERRKPAEFGINPCAEILLRNKQFCNLSICVARPDDTENDLIRKVRIATMFGTAQATLTHFPYLSRKWAENCQEEMLLGVDVTGQRDCKALQEHPQGTYILENLKRIVIETNKILSERFGLNQSVATTCIKPSGNSSQLLDCSSGLHVRYAPYYIRRVRVGAYTPVARLLKDSGVPFFPETGQSEDTATVLVFEFPVKAPESAVCRNDVTAKDQFEYWLMNKTYYTEHSASCTIYVEDHEWLSLGALVYDNWDKLSGLSFLPKSDHIYLLAPYQDLTESEYRDRISKFPVIDWSKLCDYEASDETTTSLDFACVSGSCEI